MRIKLFISILLVSIAMVVFGQNIGPKKCKFCGKPIAQCQYKGIHPQTIEINPSTSSSKPSSKQRQPAIHAVYNDGVLTCDGIQYKMVRVSGGTFTMGTTFEQGSDEWDDEKPAHLVTLSAYSIGETEVTQELWEAVTGSNPSRFKGSKRPVEQVSWNDCQKFIQKLNAATGKTFRLPTEAEWEYAARGGSKSKGYKYSGSNRLDEVCWYWGNSGVSRLSGDLSSSKIEANHCQTHPVGRKASNELGLYDMSGNVWEWCQDWYGSYSNGSQKDPKGPTSGQRRVCRGGSWSHVARFCRSSYRHNSTPEVRDGNLGLRLVLSE